MRGALVILLLAVPAFADTGPHKEGQYSGVIPGEVRDNAKPARPKRPPPRGTLTWIGFEAKGGGAEVFFQSVAPFEVSQRVEGSTLVVHLTLTRLGHNTWRQIDTRFFDSPLSGIVARAVTATRASKNHPARSAGIEARIAFKNPRDAREAAVRTSTEADGMYYAFLKFPGGTDTSSPAAAAPDEPVTKPDTAKPDTAKPDTAKPDTAKPDSQKR